MMRGNGWYNSGDCGFLGYGLGWWNYLIILGVILIVIALVLLAKRKNSSNDNQALSTLKELYVKGEITEEEYLKRKNVIEDKQVK